MLYVRDNSGKAISMIQYDYGEGPSAIGQRTYYFIYNGHGDVTALTDSSGNVVATYSYDEFGNSTGTGYGVSGTEIYNPLRYSGANNAYYDTETSLYKMGARYYQPDVGRWLTRDSYKGEQEDPQSQNRYVYVKNNPLKYADPSGREPITIGGIIATIGTVIVVAATIKFIYTGYQAYKWNIRARDLAIRIKRKYKYEDIALKHLIKTKTYKKAVYWRTKLFMGLLQKGAMGRW